MQKLSNIILGFWASYWVFAKRNTSYVPHNMMNAFTMVTSALCTFLLHEGKTYFFCIHRCISQRYLHNWPFANGEFEAPSTQPTSDIYERHANIFFLARRSPISLTKGKRQAYQSGEPYTDLKYSGCSSILFSRWAMFGIAVGLLTEYATGSDFVDQLKIIVSNLGIADLEWRFNCI